MICSNIVHTRSEREPEEEKKENGYARTRKLKCVKCLLCPSDGTELRQINSTQCPDS